jgi:NADH dehydrogenase/NADH:ubiquinone oxidoreductase 75 kD subunit (chain G)
LGIKKNRVFDVMDAVGSNIRVDTYGWEVKRVLPRINEDINEEWISDKTRYACDGLKNQRLDSPFIKEGNKFKKISWREAYDVIKEKISNTNSDKVGCFTGDLTNMETCYAAKELINKVFKSTLIDSRSDDYYVNYSNNKNYRFNSNIAGIEDSDFILIIGANPRYEATILNSRIRKAYLKSKLPIFSTNDIGDQTYPYKILDNSTNLIQDIIQGKNPVGEQIIQSLKPIIILGQSVLKLKSGQYVFEELNKFLNKHNKINDDWNALNTLSNDASTVGSYDLTLFSSNNGRNLLLEN